MNLFELDRAIADALEIALSTGIDEETGEILDGSFDAFEALNAERDTKLENCGMYIKNLNVEIEGIKTEIAAMKDRIDAKKRKIDRMTEYVTASLLNNDQTAFETARVAFSFRKSVAVNITDAAVIPAEYMKTKTETSPDKNAIKKAINAGVTITGAELVENMNLQIK